MEMSDIHEVLDVALGYVRAMQDDDRDAARAAWEAMDGDESLPLHVYLSAMTLAMDYEAEQIGGDEV